MRTLGVNNFGSTMKPLFLCLLFILFVFDSIHCKTNLNNINSDYDDDEDDSDSDEKVGRLSEAKTFAETVSYSLISSLFTVCNLFY